MKITQSLGLPASIGGRIKILKELRGIKTFDRLQRMPESFSVRLELVAKECSVTGRLRNPVELRIISLGVEIMDIVIAN